MFRLPSHATFRSMKANFWVEPPSLDHLRFNSLEPLNHHFCLERHVASPFPNRLRKDTYGDTGSDFGAEQIKEFEPGWP